MAGRRGRLKQLREVDTELSAVGWLSDHPCEADGPATVAGPWGIPQRVGDRYFPPGPAERLQALDEAAIKAMAEYIDRSGCAAGCSGEQPQPRNGKLDRTEMLGLAGGNDID